MFQSRETTKTTRTTDLSNVLNSSEVGNNQTGFSKCNCKKKPIAKVALHAGETSHHWAAKTGEKKQSEKLLPY